MRLFGLWSLTKSVALLFVFFCSISYAEISVIDDSGRRVTLSAPAKRIVSLAPHATELLFIAGAGKKSYWRVLRQRLSERGIATAFNRQ